MLICRYEKELARRVAKLGPHHVQVAISHLHLAELYKQREDLFHDARTQYESALKIMEQQFGKEHLEAARVHEQFASLFEKYEQFSTAEEHLRTALRIKETTTDVTELAEVLENFAMVCIKRGNTREGIHSYHRSLQLKKKKYPKTIIPWFTLKYMVKVIPCWFLLI